MKIDTDDLKESFKRRFELEMDELIQFFLSNNMVKGKLSDGLMYISRRQLGSGNFDNFPDILEMETALLDDIEKNVEKILDKKKFMRKVGEKISEKMASVSHGQVDDTILEIKVSDGRPGTGASPYVLEFDHDDLEPPFQSVVFLDMFSILIDRRGSDTLDFTA